ncbi:MAG: hypothetical protein ACREQV_11515, partial [Candidatus Binatia bacterium]
FVTADEARAGNYDKAAIALIFATLKPAKLVNKSLGVNPFKGKTAEEIGAMLQKKGYVPMGDNPLVGRGTFVNPKTGRGYHIDARHPDPKGPHVGVHRPREKQNALPPRDYPMGGS